MKKLLFVTTAFLTAVCIYAFTARQTVAIKNLKEYKLKNTLACTPDRNFLQQLIEGTDIPVMPGAGKYKWKISTPIGIGLI